MLRGRFLDGDEEGLPGWIYEELRDVASSSYRFADEGDVTDVVEDLCENVSFLSTICRHLRGPGTIVLPSGSRYSPRSLIWALQSQLKCLLIVLAAIIGSWMVDDFRHSHQKQMAPWYGLPAERVLDGASLYFGDRVDNAMVKSLLFDYLTPVSFLDYSCLPCTLL